MAVNEDQGQGEGLATGREAKDGKEQLSPGTCLEIHRMKRKSKARTGSNEKTGII